MRTLIGASLVFFSLVGAARAGTLIAEGSVKALTNVTQLEGIVG